MAGEFVGIADEDGGVESLGQFDQAPGIVGFGAGFGVPQSQKGDVGLPAGGVHDLGNGPVGRF